MKSIQILRPGSFKAVNGEEISFSESDLIDVTKSYSPEIFEAPLVLGHPKHNDGAMGWIKSLSFADGVLSAEPDKVEPKLIELIEAGRYKKVSASLFLPDSKSNPMPGKYYLRHVGLLGAVAPAVNGLAPISLIGDGNESVTIEFAISDESSLNLSNNEKEKLMKEKSLLEAKEKELSAREKVLAQKEAEVRKAEFAANLDELIKDGRVYVGLKNDLIEFMQSIDSSETIEFTENRKQTPVEFLQNILKRQPKLVEFSEIAPESKTVTLDKSNSAQIAEFATKLQTKLLSEGTAISFAEAVERTVGGNK